MVWYFYLIYFFAGAFLANSIPHFVNGISGRKFPTPFTRPVGGPTVNVVWGFMNFVVGYLLLILVGSFAFGFTYDSLAVLLGIFAIGISNSIVFGKRKI